MISKEDELWHFQVEAYLGDVSPEDVHVELYADPLTVPGQLDREEPIKVVMDQREPIVGTMNGFFVLCKRIRPVSCGGLYASDSALSSGGVRSQRRCPYFMVALI